MHSTREDVKALLGPGQSTYSLEEEEVFIVFASEEILNLSKCDAVPLGTVLMIRVTPKSETLVSSLQLDEKTLKKFNPSRAPDVELEGFIDETEGLVIRADKGKVQEIVYLPSGVDRGRCPGYYEDPESFVRIGEFACRLGLDGYGNIRFSDEKARLDNFAIQLQNEPKTQGYIIVYAGQKATFAQAEKRANRARDYLIKVRGISPERVKAIDGGFRVDFEVRLYILPDGAEPPPLMPTLDPSDVEIINEKPRPPKRKPN